MTALITIMGCRTGVGGVSVSMVTVVAMGGGGGAVVGGGGGGVCAWRNGEETVAEGGVS